MADRRQSAVGDLWRETEAVKLLLAAYAEDLGDDEQAKADLIEGQTSLNEALDICVARLADIDGFQVGIKVQADKLKARKERYERQESRIRQALLEAMEVSGKQRHESPVGTISRRTLPPSVIVTDETLVPAVYWRRADPTLDRKALLAALKDLPPGESIPGATLSNGGAGLAVKLT